MPIAQKFTWTDPETGEVHKRTSQSKTYTHAVVGRKSGAFDRAEAEAKLSSQQEYLTLYSNPTAEMLGRRTEEDWADYACEAAEHIAETEQHLAEALFEDGPLVALRWSQSHANATKGMGEFANPHKRSGHKLAPFVDVRVEEVD